MSYPYRIFIISEKEFNNFFLFSYYLENYVLDQTILYTAKPTRTDDMTEIFAVKHNLPHLSCKAAEILKRVGNRVLFDKIADATDLLLIFGDSSHYSKLIGAFTKRKKRYEVIAIEPTDYVTKPEGNFEATVTFSSLYGPYLKGLSADNKFLCYKFLAALTMDIDLLKLVMRHRKDVYLTSNRVEEEIANNLYWICKNQYASLVELKKTLSKQPEREEDPYLHTEPYAWQYGGERIPVYTGTGLLLAKAYSDLVKTDSATLIEIRDRDIIKSHVYKALIDEDQDEDNSVRITHHTADKQSYPLFYQASHFDGSIIKAGYWYIDASYVTVKQQ